MNWFLRLGFFLIVSLGAAAPLPAAEHPVPLPKDTDAAKCLECHEDKGKGKSVHSAIAMGCTSCHEINTQNDTTTINLTAPPEQICFNCHTKSEENTQHGPYDNGQCVFCHDPHTSDFPKQLRSEGNSLCFECHLNLKDQGEQISIFGKHEYTADQWRDIPELGLDPQRRLGHPTAMHPVSGVPNPMNPAEQMSCLTCHAPHATAAPKLLVRRKRPADDICTECHKVIDDKQTADHLKTIPTPQQAPASTPDKNKKSKR